MLRREGALPAGLRQTASDRPGEAQPVPTRDVPRHPWGGIAVAALIILTAGVTAMEVNARRIGLHAGDIDNSEVEWVKERARSEGAAIQSR